MTDKMTLKNKLYIIFLCGEQDHDSKYSEEEKKLICSARGFVFIPSLLCFLFVIYMLLVIIEIPLCSLRHLISIDFFKPLICAIKPSTFGESFGTAIINNLAKLFMIILFILSILAICLIINLPTFFVIGIIKFYLILRKTNEYMLQKDEE